MRDDDFAELVTGAVDTSVDIFIMCDCCHSGTIGDFSHQLWNGYRAISLSGCTDQQTSGDTGKGGICTHSLLMAIQNMQETGLTEYSVGQLYNQVLQKDDTVFDSAQDITINWTNELADANDMHWPLVPQGAFQAPWN